MSSETTKQAGGRYWKKLIESGVAVEDVTYRIDGVLVADKMLFAKMTNKTVRTIDKYVAEGMPIHVASTSSFIVLDVIAAQNWILNTKGNGQPRSMQPDQPKSEAATLKEKLNERKMIAETEKVEAQALREKIKLAEEEGRLVDANDLDKAMAELAVMFKTDKTNDEKVLPVVLEGRTSPEITQLLHEHNQERLSMLDKIINRVFRSKETLYDIIEAVLYQLKIGIEPEELVNRVKNQPQKSEREKRREEKRKAKDA